ncbi:MAG: hypothetical protein MZU91_11645 [Desulfosudis oleivorans]|nr:hypothetical protein [Desulfosudis oleivorans]
MTTYVPDTPAVYERLTGLEYLNFIGDVYGVPKAERLERIGKWLEIFELARGRHQSHPELLARHAAEDRTDRGPPAGAPGDDPRRAAGRSRPARGPPDQGDVPRALRRAARRSSSRPTSWRWPRSSATASASSTGAAWSPAGRWPSSRPSTGRRPGSPSRRSSWS